MPQRIINMTNHNRTHQSISTKMKLATILVSAAIVATTVIPANVAYANHREGARHNLEVNEQELQRKAQKARSKKRASKRKKARNKKSSRTARTAEAGHSGHRSNKVRKNRKSRRNAEYNHHQRRQNNHHGKKRHHRKNRGNDDIGALLAAGVIGLAIGAISSESNHRRETRVKRYDEYDSYLAPRQPVYSEYQYGSTSYREYGSAGYGQHGVQSYPQYGSTQRPIVRKSLNEVNAPQVITYQDSASLEPWSAGWLEYCDNRYRSFDRQSGTFMGYDGQRHFCVPK